MTNLRQAAEMALKYFEDAYGLEDEEVAIKEALRQALAHEALDRMVAENQKLGLYDDNLQTTIERGTKAWADVPDASQWVDELRGNDKPPVKSYCGGKPNYCTPEEAFTLDRGCYERGCVAFDERDGDGVIMLGKRVHKTDKSIHEPAAWRNTETGEFCTGGFLRKDLARWIPLYAAPYTKLDTTAGVLHKEWVGLTANEVYECWKSGDVVAAVQDRLKEKNT